MNESKESAPTVGLVTVATGRYVDFLPPLIEGARKHLIGLGPVFVLTDAEQLDCAGDVRILKWPRMDWPLPTLLRYRGFCEYSQALSEVDVLLYTDADMLFIGDVDVREVKGLIAVRHPGYVRTTPGELPYERRPASTACVPRGNERHYFCGGVQGGQSDLYLAAARVIDEAVAADQAKGVTAVWHDESHWNRYLIDHPASLELGLEYCSPDTAVGPDTRIAAITKDHAYFRDLTSTQQVRDLTKRVSFSIRLRMQRLKRRLQ